jgi:hypothetical protein
MRNLFAFFVFLFMASFTISTISKAQTSVDINYVSNTFYPATALLYGEDESGSLKMRCTATAIEKNDKGYVFVTAAHCGCIDDDEMHTTSPEKTFFYITTDMEKEKTFIKADVIGCGYRTVGDDFMLLQVNTNKQLPTVNLGQDPVALEAIINVAAPLGLGKQVFLGSVSSATLDRPVVLDDINWSHAVLLQLFGVDGGSSGSAVVCLDQKAVCAFVVGSINKTTMVAIPVSRLIKLRSELAAGTYTHWVKDPDSVHKK